MPVGSAVAVAVRPEKIVLATDPLNDANRLAGNVESVSFRGEASTYRIALPTGKIVRVTQTNRDRAGAGIAERQKVWLGWSARAAMVLEP